MAGFERSLGYRGVAVDVARLVELAREFWPAVAGKTALTLAQLSSFEALSDRLLTAIGRRDQGPAVAGEAALRRQRAFTLFVRAYDDVRRGVIYLRHHQGDADDVMPSLYAKGSMRRKLDARPRMAAGSVASATSPVPAVTSVATGSAVATGLPGSNPFGSSS